MPLAVLALEPWYGGSHRAFLDAWRIRSRHRVEVLGLAPRSWTWRMEAGAWELARRVRAERRAPPDVLFASDYVDLPAFYGWLPAGWESVPALLYVHENQLTYPSRGGADPPERDLHHGFTNIESCLRARRAVFNSRFHRDAFASAADELLARLPKPNPRAEVARRLAEAAVVGPGISLDEIPLGRGAPSGAPLRVLFNHRWEHDKDPLAFLAAVRDARGRGARIELALLGERFGDLPEGVGAALEELTGAIVDSGFVEDRSQYALRIGACDVAVSTARHEFYGIAVLEALAAGCTPLLPARMSYPELLSPGLRAAGLYGDPSDLAARLAAAAASPSTFRERAVRRRARAAAARHAAPRTARALDRLCDEAAG